MIMLLWSVYENGAVQWKKQCILEVIKKHNMNNKHYLLQTKIIIMIGFMIKFASNFIQPSKQVAF